MKKWVKRVRDALDEDLSTVEDRDSSTTTAAVVEENLIEYPDMVKAPSLGSINHISSLIEQTPETLMGSSVIKNVESELEKSFKYKRILHRNIEMAKTGVKQRARHYKVSQKVQYDSMVVETAKLFNQLVLGEKVPYSTIKNKVQNFYATLVQDKHFLLNLSTIRTEVHNDKSLYYHAVNNSLMAMTIPTTLGFSKQEIIEIGVAALLADVGMELVPKSIQFKKTKLDKNDLFEVEKHPIFTCNILENIKDMPMGVVLGAYQHHERESGSGYPKQRKSHVIHEYAQIISTVDVYEALTSPRPHRDPILPYNAMRNLLDQTKLGLLNKDKVRSFLEHFGLFPIGSLVKISDGSIAKVVGSNGKDVTKPILAVLTTSEKKPLQPASIYFKDLLKDEEEKILSSVGEKDYEAAILLGF